MSTCPLGLMNWKILSKIMGFKKKNYGFQRLTNLLEKPHFQLGQCVLIKTYSEESFSTNKKTIFEKALF